MKTKKILMIEKFFLNRKIQTEIMSRIEICKIRKLLIMFHNLKHLRMVDLLQSDNRELQLLNKKEDK